MFANLFPDVSYSGEDRELRRTIQLASLTALLLIVGCDPGMTIREAVQRDRLHAPSVTASPNRVLISVKTDHAFIGETWYDPTITVTNLSSTQITITAVELAAKGTVYADKRQAAYPLVVRAGQSVTVDPAFDLRDNVKTFFRRPADLRANYAIHGQQTTAHATIVGGSSKL